MTSVPATQSNHVLCAVLSRQDNAGEPLIRSGFYKLLRLGRTHDSDLVAKATGCTSNVQEHDLAATHVTVIGGDVEFFLHPSTPSPAYGQVHNSYRNI